MIKLVQKKEKEVLINSYTLLSLMGGLTLDSVQLMQPKNIEN